MTLIRFSIRKGLRQNFHLTKKIPLCRVTLWNVNSKRSICLSIQFLVSINYLLCNFLLDKTIEQTMNRPELGRLDSLIMLMLFIFGFYHATNVQKSLEATLKWLEKQRALIRKKTLVSPDMRRMKQTFKMLCIQLSSCKIHLHIM